MSAQAAAGQTPLELRTYSQVEHAIKMAGFTLPPGKEPLEALFKRIGPSFRDSLHAIIGRKEGWEQHYDLVKSLTQVLSPQTRSMLERLGISGVSMDALVEVGKTEDVRAFLVNLKAAFDGTDPDGINFVKRQLGTATRMLDNPDGLAGQSPARQPEPATPPRSEAPRPTPAHGAAASPQQTGQAAPPPPRWPDRSGAPREEGTPQVERDFRSVHVYGGGGALCFQATTGTDEKTQTLRIEGAKSTGPRQYDWKNKVALQLSPVELVRCVAVFMGWLPKLEISAHGPAHDKYAHIEVQKGKFFVKVGQKDGTYVAVPVPAEEAYYVLALFTRQMLKNDPHLGSHEAVLKLVQRVISMPAPAAGLQAAA